MLVGEGVTDGVIVGVTVGVSVIVGVCVQVGADKMGPDTPRERDVRNFSTMPSLSARSERDGQRLLINGMKRGC